MCIAYAHEGTSTPTTTRTPRHLLTRAQAASAGSVGNIQAFHDELLKGRFYHQLDADIATGKRQTANGSVTEPLTGMRNAFTRLQVRSPDDLQHRAVHFHLSADRATGGLSMVMSAGNGKTS
ncbi:hypothetical protein AWB69_08594 [Caballeronia udeis]|uniref:Uncharacterized protein n=1 Tax=Caballeronia udeis TaxID=1232866 RepID=A0A158JQQ6_9BURK|nr:hypothetical protein [Caballeronia udeis]SAL71254.1 hypothetical protein AWB69_08594 [Caballeronia udeis]